jgi:hypothetical protein
MYATAVDAEKHTSLSTVTTVHQHCSQILKEAALQPSSQAYARAHMMLCCSSHRPGGCLTLLPLLLLLLPARLCFWLRRVVLSCQLKTGGGPRPWTRQQGWAQQTWQHTSAAARRQRLQRQHAQH